MKENKWININKTTKFRFADLGQKAKSKRTRKGKYLIIRDDKIHKQSYEKVKADYPIQEPIKYAQKKWRGKMKKTRKKFYEEERLRIKKAIKKEKIFTEGTFGKPLIRNINEIIENPYKTYQELLYNAVSHKKLRAILIKEAQKWSNLIGYDTRIYGIPDGQMSKELMGEFQDKNKTIEEYVELYTKHGYTQGHHLDSQQIKTDWPTIKYIEDSATQPHTGDIKEVITTIILGK